jgi:hypothetical protein
MGRAYNNTNSMCLGRYFTYEERIGLEAYLLGHSNYKKIVNKSTLASNFHKNRRTIQREIQRGWCFIKEARYPLKFKNPMLNMLKTWLILTTVLKVQI